MRDRVGLISDSAAGMHQGSKVVNYVKLWNVATGALLWTSAEGDLGHVNSLVFSPDGTSIYCCDDSATSRIDATDRTDAARLDESRRWTAEVGRRPRPNNQ